MTVPADGDVARPTFQSQLPTCICVLSGKCLGGVSCSSYGMAMGVDQGTFGAKRPTGCALRKLTGDVTGGLTLPQVARVAEERYGVDVEVRVGSNVISPAAVAAHLRAGGGVGLQGNTRALLSHPGQRSTGTAVNHYVHVASVRDGTWYAPKYALVYDPAANGRVAGWGKAAQGPQWWPWTLVLAFASALRPWGEDDSRTLGPGRMYAGLIEPPNVVLRYGGKRTKPFPDRTRVDVAAGRKANVRSRPDRIAPEYVVDHKADGALFVAYQRTTSGASVAGSRVWYGNRTGTRWLPAARLIHEGGDT